jgi:hypothetical protein
MILPPRIIGSTFLLSFLTLSSLVFCWSYWIEPSRLIVADYELRLRNWDPALNGYKVVAISDIHGGSNGASEAKLKELVERANALDPDLILLIGDFVSSSLNDRKAIKMPVEAVASNLKGFRARDGVFAVLGNQDDAYDPQSVRVNLEKAGITVLENEAVRVERSGRYVDILGMPDGLHIELDAPEAYYGPAVNALRKLGPEKGNVILFTHNPDSIDYIAGGVSTPTDVGLFLAGHTHGGQISLPFVGPPVVLGSSFGQRFAKGFVRDEVYKTDMFITSGIGTSVLPFRLGVPPEISVLHLYSEDK